MLRPQTPIASGGWWLRPQALSVPRLSCTNFLSTSPNFDMLVKLFNLRFSFPFSKSWLRAKSDPQHLIFHSLSHANSLFSKISEDVIACDLQFCPLPNPKPWLPLCITSCAICLPNTGYCILVLLTHLHERLLTTLQRCKAAK